jgi:hypothetical protein
MKHALLFLFLLTSIDCFSQDLEHDRLALIKLYESLDGENWEFAGGPVTWVVPGNPGDDPCAWSGIGCAQIGGTKRVISVELNDLGGTIPAEIGNLDAVKYLTLSGGEGVFTSHLPLSGKIPKEILNLKNIESLDLSRAIFDQESLDLVFGLTSLKTLTLTPVSPISDQFDKLVNLENLGLYGYVGSAAKSENNGPVPVSLGSLAKLKTLVIERTGFDGPIPPEIGNLKNLSMLIVYGLTNAGPIPPEIGKLSNLTNLVLSNQHTGSIPVELNNLTSIINVSLDRNLLDGPIPNFSALPGNSITVSYNNFNFDQLEPNALHLREYYAQKLLKLNRKKDILSVYAGGTLSRNTYRWYRDGKPVATIVGDSTYKMEIPGIYHVHITNSVATNGVMRSEIYNPALPVTLVSFYAKKENDKNHLTWKTTSETINLGFEIEKSADARTFEKIGFVDGNGDTHETKNYHFTDANPFTTTYYRLKQLDRATDGNDGNFEYSRIISVKRENAKLSIHPNPAKDHFLVNGLEREEDMVVRNVEGRILLKRKVVPNQQVMTGSLSNGLYLIQIGSESKKVLIEQ